MPVWRVRATWIEDETEATEHWEIDAATADEAVRRALMHIRFTPHHVEASRKPDIPVRKPGEARHVAR